MGRQRRRRRRLLSVRRWSAHFWDLPSMDSAKQATVIRLVVCKKAGAVCERFQLFGLDIEVGGLDV